MLAVSLSLEESGRIIPGRKSNPGASALGRWCVMIPVPSLECLRQQFQSTLHSLPGPSFSHSASAVGQNAFINYYAFKILWSCKKIFVLSRFRFDCSVLFASSGKPVRCSDRTHTPGSGPESLLSCKVCRCQYMYRSGVTQCFSSVIWAFNKQKIIWKGEKQLGLMLLIWNPVTFNHQSHKHEEIYRLNILK